MDGVVLIDKPRDMTSHQVVGRLRKHLHQKKVGHAGTLDPLASGLLICCLGKATKISEYLMATTKTYEVEIKLGWTSATYDEEGPLTQTHKEIPSLPDIQKALQSFVGTFDQLPPMHSAIKIKGKKLYEYARADQHVERTPRKVTIHDIRVGFMNQDIVTITVDCHKGTYMRSLAHDLGEALGCGGYALHIRRLQSGAFDVANTLDVNHLEDLDRYFMSITQALATQMKVETISDEQSLHIQQGRCVQKMFEEVQTQGVFLAASESNEAVALIDNTPKGAIIRRVF